MATGLEGVRELTGQLNSLGASVAAKELRGTAKSAMQIAEHRARARLPQGVDAHYTYKGRLVSPGYALSTLHIETKVDKKRGAAVAMLGVGREAFYAVQFVELGTARMAAQPWLRPAFEESEDPMLTQLAEELRNRVIRATKREARRIARAGA